jgi:hypothetical protein
VKKPQKFFTNVGGSQYNIPMNVKMIDTEKAEILLGMTKEGHWVAPAVVVNTPKGLAVVCYEGVGWFEDEGMYNILVGDEYRDWTKQITKKELLSIISNEETTLRQLIDPHNDRTRSNLFTWENQIKNTPQNVVGSEYNERKKEVANGIV